MKLNLRRILPLVVAVMVVSIISLLPLTVSAASYPMTSGDPEISNALDYLKSQQNSDGGMGDMSSTAWTIMAVAAVGENPADWEKEGKSLVDYTKDNLSSLDLEFNIPNAYSRTILAVVAAEEDPYDFGGTDLVAKLKTFYDGTQIGDVNLLNDDYWGILALVAAGESQDSLIVQQSKLYILKYQQSDNGWAYDIGAVWGTDVDSTGEAIMALVAAGESVGSQAISEGLDYIKTNQGSDGGFQSWGASNSDTTCRGMGAILAAGQDPTSEQWQKDGNNAMDFLLGLQMADGSFEWQSGNPGFTPVNTTSNAIIALVGKHYPVKSVSVTTLEERVTALESEKDTLATRFWIAVGVGGLGVILGIVGLARRRRV